MKIYKLVQIGGVCELVPGQIINRGKEKYKVLKLLGEGGMGKVYKIQKLDIKNGNGVYAIKITDKKENVDVEKRINRYLVSDKEGCKDENVSCYLNKGDWTVSGSKGVKCYLLLTHFYDTNLEILIRQKGLQGLYECADETKQKYIQNIYFSFITQIIGGVAYFHNKNMAHGDIKPANMMIDSSTNDLVLIDFDTVCRADKDDMCKTGESFKMSLFYVSPKMSRYSGQDKNHISDLKRSDLWAFTVSCFEVWYGKDFWTGLLNSTFPTDFYNMVEKLVSLQDESVRVMINKGEFSGYELDPMVREFLQTIADEKNGLVKKFLRYIIRVMVIIVKEEDPKRRVSRYITIDEIKTDVDKILSF